MLLAVSIALLRLLAFCVHTDMQRIQEMHFPVSVTEGLSSGIALAGHPLAQTPHFWHDFPAFGFNGTPL